MTRTARRRASQKKRMDVLEKWRRAAVLPHIHGFLLDIGCGYNHLVEIYGHGVGIDVHRWDGIDVQGNVSALPLPNKSSDTVTLIAALNHIPNREKALKEIWRVLRPGGRLLITMIGPLTGIAAHVLFRHDEETRGGMAQGELKGMDFDHVRRLIRDTGFDIESERGFELGLNRLFAASKPGR